MAVGLEVPDLTISGPLTSQFSGKVLLMSQSQDLGLVRPNLFIVGAPKCGTTSMHDYLDQHPEIFMSRNKEPRHFADELEIDPRRYIGDRSTYLGLFQEGRDARYRGESSPLYLFSQTAAQRIKEFEPDARIIIMLRNPVDMINSLHLERINTGNEDLLSLQEALDAEPERREGKRIPPTTRLKNCHVYTEIATFSPQVQRFFDQFDRDKVHIIIFDDLKSNVQRVYRETLEFLQVDPNVEVDLGIRNQSRPVTGTDLAIKRFFTKNRKLKRLLVDPLPDPVLKFYRRLVSKTGKVLRDQQIDPTLRNRLVEQFRPEVDRLSTLIDCDLSHWSAQS